MKDIQRLRVILCETFRHALSRTRFFASSLEGGTEVIDRLARGEPEDRVLASVVDVAMLELGYATPMEATRSESKIARAVSKGSAKRRADGVLP